MSSENRPLDDPVDILIQNVTILPLPDPARVIPRGWLAIKKDRIAAIHPGDPPGIRALHTIEGRGCLAMPGLVNAHTHAAMTLFRGLADDLPLKKWLEEHIFPAERNWVNEEFVYWGTLLACAEMIRAGTTTFADGYFFEEEAARAAAQAGMRAVLGQGLLDFPTPDSPAPASSLKRAEALVETYRGHPLLRPALFAHSAATCSPQLLQESKARGDRWGVPLFIHLAETRQEAAEVIRRYGRTPVQHLESLGLLSPHLIACHSIWVDEEEMDLLAQRGVKVVHNPESNMKLASGVAPVPQLLARGVTVGLGTDGCASNNNLDLFGEMDAAAKLHKVHCLDPTVMPAQTVLNMATLGGAGVLGLEPEIGSLEAGKKADVIILDFHRPHLQPLYSPISHLVYCAGGADVREVIIEGKRVMENRRLLTIDEDELLSRTREWQARIGG